MAKIIGYILALIGLFGVGVYAIPELNSYVGVPAQYLGLPLVIVSAVVILIGIFFIVKGGSGRQPKEVPIFHGKNVVGYRRR